MKQTLLIVLFVVIGQQSIAQNLMDRVSKDAEFVLEFGMEKMEKIYSHKKIFKNAMWKDIAKDGDMKSIVETGVDFTKPAYIAIDITDSCTFFSFHFHLSNKDKFVKMMSKSNKNITIIDNYKESGFTYLQSGRDNNLFYDENSATMNFSSLNRSYRRENMDYLMEVYYEDIKDFEYEYQQENAIEGIIARNRSLEILMNKPASFTTSDCYKLIDKKEEINIWINKLYSQLGKITNDRDFRRFSNVFSTFDAHQLITLSMDKGAVSLDYRMNFDNDIQKQMANITEGRSLNKEFLKYIPKDRFGVYQMSINPKAYYDWLKESLASSLGGNYISDQSVRDIVDLIETLIDEEAISNLVSGDVLFSFNKVQKGTREYITSKYNENFELEEKVQTREVEYPEFTVLLGVKNKKFFQKILDIMKRENLLKEEMGYFFIPGNRDFPVGFGVRLEDDKLIISNDFELFKRIEKKNLYTPNTVESDLSYYGELRISALFETLLKDVNNYSEYTFMAALRDNFEILEMKSQKVNNGMGIKGSLKMVDQKKNAYVSIIDMINNLYQLNEIDRNKGKYDFYSTRLKELIKEYEVLPSDRKSMSGDEAIKRAKAALQSKEAKEEPYLLRRLFWDLEDAIKGQLDDSYKYEYDKIEEPVEEK
jgi:hypothetical protein